MILQLKNNGVSMKKITLALIPAVALAFVGCDLFGDDSSSSFFASQSGELVNATETESESYASQKIIEVDSSTAQLTITGLPSGKKIWMTKTNPTKTTISARYTRSVDSMVGASPNSKSTATESSGSGGGIIGWLPWLFGGSGEAAPCTTLALNTHLSMSVNPTAARSVISEPAKAVTQITPVVNSTTKQIFVDTNSAMSSYAKKTATLRAKSDYCYVWVIDDTDARRNKKYWTESPTLSEKGQQINSKIAQSIADNFDEIYPMVREVFGNESDKIIYQANNIYDMNTYSDTGTKVNIVVYDIGNDFGSSSGGGTVGYFYAKDYYYQYNSGAAAYSNAGKYFYIDAYYTANETAMVYSTLAHEFQHMVDFGVKTMSSFETAKKQDDVLQSSSWYNEMKSMLCEDIMKNYLEESNEPDFTDDDSPFSRLPMFCRHYYDTGLEYKTNGSYDVYYSYANNYAFGAWAARNYGGVSFINKIATNKYVDIESITNAAGTSITELLKAYTQDCVLNRSGHGFNKEVTQTKFTSNGYDYPLDAVDLWGLKTVLKNSYSDYKKAGATSDISSFYSYDGPVYFSYNSQTELRPYGFTLVLVGKTSGSTATLNFNTSNIDNAQKTYIIIE